MYALRGHTVNPDGLPNVFFQATMAHAILRYNGAQLGKMDYIGSIPTREG